MLAGQPISLLRNGQVIGKAFVNGDGTADDPGRRSATARCKPGELEVAIEGDGAQPFKVPVAGVPRARAAGSRRQRADRVDDHRDAPGRLGCRPVQGDDHRQPGADATFSFAGLAAGASATQSYTCAALLRQRQRDRRLGRSVTASDGHEQLDRAGDLRLRRDRHDDDAHGLTRNAIEENHRDAEVCMPGRWPLPWPRACSS